MTETAGLSIGESILDMLGARAGEKFTLHERFLNPKMVQVLKTIGFDRHYARAEGAYLYDREGNDECMLC